jgi:dTDP-4-dehydrorhamnose 3,5-epimerase-like enzyme
MIPKYIYLNIFHMIPKYFVFDYYILEATTVIAYCTYKTFFKKIEKRREIPMEDAALRLAWPIAKKISKCLKKTLRDL